MIPSLGFAMALQFKPDGQGGWHYRKDQIGAPLPATAAERESYIRWYGWITLSGFLLFFATMIVLAIAMDAMIPNATDNQGAVGAIFMAAITFGVTYLYLKWFSHAPARAFADRAPAGPAQTRKQVFGRRMARFSYWRLVWVIGGLVLLGIAGLWERPDAWWLPPVLFVPIGLMFAYWKWSIEREPG